MAHDKTSDVVIESDSGPVIKKGSLLRLSWSPEDIIPVESHENFTVDIVLRLYNDISHEWTDIELANGVSNTGYFEVVTPWFYPPKNVDDSICLALIQIRISKMKNWTRDYEIENITKEGIKAASIFSRLVILEKKQSCEKTRREACELWGCAQSRHEALQTLASLPPCPCTVSAINRRDFEEEKGTLSEIFHQGSDRCFQERKM